MKKSKSLLRTQRFSLDEKLKNFKLALGTSIPKSGWVKAVRESLGMTSAQLAERMGIRQSGVILMEQREVEKKVTLETLQRAAHAMECELVYALVPRESLEKIVDDQAKAAAQEFLKTTVHSMDLEKQKVNEPETRLHLEELSAEIKTKMDNRLWRKQ